MNNIKKNISLQFIYQIIITITPLITSPYLSRRLGAEGLGIYSYTYSILSYFILFAMLGFNNYGTRSIALCKSKCEEQQKFSEIYYLQLICCFISFIVFVFLLLFCDVRDYLFLQSFYLISCFLDVTWYFFGKERFKIIIFRNLVIRILTVVLILLLIKEPSDVGKYILIMSLSTLLSQISLWPTIFCEIKFKKVNIRSIIAHFKPVIILFVPILAMSIYHIMDKTMLGLFGNKLQSGYYYNADKIVNIPLCVITGVNTVMLPSVTSLISKEKIAEAKALIKKSVKYFSCISVAFAFGLTAICDDFVPFFFGKGYEDCIVLIKIFSFIIIVKTISDVIRTQYMIPFKKEKYFIIAVVVGSFINLVLNFILICIFKMGALGATLATFISELVVCILQMFFVSKDIAIKSDVLFIIYYFINGVVMYCIIRGLSYLPLPVFIKIVLEVLIGGLTYMLLTYVLFKAKKDDIIGLFNKRGGLQ